MNKKFFVLLAVTIYCSIAFAQITPVFEVEEMLLFTNGNPIQPIHPTPSHTVPVVTDWNGDGAFDIILGSFYGGRVYFYPNSGTNNFPLFFEENAGAMEAGGVPISVSSG